MEKGRSIKKQAIILLCHGSPEPEWTIPFLRLQDEVAAQTPDSIVSLAFLAPATPNFSQVIEQLVSANVGACIVAPIFLARGGHVKRDLPQLVADAKAKHNIDICVLETLGEVPGIIKTIATWIVAASKG